LSSEIRALVVGSISRDLLASGESAPGGVPQWAGLALLRLGARVRVLTRAADADDALLDPLRRAGAEVLRVPSRATTACRNDYTIEGDRHELWACSDPIAPEHVPDEWRSADLVQLGPLHRRDLAPGIARVLRARVGLDAQGLVRSGRGPRTRLARARGLEAQLAGVDVLKASDAELPFLLGPGQSPEDWLARHGIRELLITRGARGASLITSDGRIELPARPARARHLVGAGDVFLAAYLYARVLGASSLAAARLATRASAAKIEAGEIPAGFAVEEALR
jgi:sugar/nucleoside kinase (ribokinase family)